MTVYVDVLLCVNIFINFFLLLCVKKFLKINTSARRLVLTSAAASVLSLAVFLPEMPFVISLLFKIASGCLVVFSAFGKAGFKVFFKRVCMFIFVNIGFCGLMMLFYRITKSSNILIFNDVIYFQISPVLLIIITVICYFILRFLQKITGREEVGKLFYNVKISMGGKSYSCVGKADTGCTLKEPFSGAPVIVVERDVLGDFSPDERICRIIPFESMGGDGIIKGFLPEKLDLNEKTVSQKVYIGISERKFNGEFQALINAEVL